MSPSMDNTGRQTKYIFVTGGVVSSLGKGLAAASIGALLEGHGYQVTLQKFDPYINVDPGTMSPYQHGEVYVTDDGAETDLDLGHYERFTHMTATSATNRAMSIACASLSMTHGPSMKASGCPVPNVTGPALTGATACT